MQLVKTFRRKFTPAPIFIFLGGGSGVAFLVLVVNCYVSTSSQLIKFYCSVLTAYLPYCNLLHSTGMSHLKITVTMSAFIQSTSIHVEVQKESEYKHKYTLCAVALFIFKN